jgi:hypothetical protein
MFGDAWQHFSGDCSFFLGGVMTDVSIFRQSRAASGHFMLKFLPGPPQCNNTENQVWMQPAWLITKDASRNSQAFEWQVVSAWLSVDH